MVVEGFLLGLSSGSYCLFSCSPIAVPLFMDHTMGYKQAINRLLLFLSGRLMGYILFGFILSITGAFILGYFDPFIQKRVEALSLIIAGVILLLPLKRHKTHEGCIMRSLRSTSLSAVLLGLITGLSFCPPFLSAASRVINQGVGGGVLYFVSFFIGTSLLLLPFGMFSLLNRFQSALKHMGRYLRLIIGIYFILISGVLAWFV